MKITHRLAIGFGLVTLVIVVCGFSGYHGLELTRASLEFVTGPAWDTADGGMESTIEIEAQMIAARKLAAGIQREQSVQIIEDSRRGADEAIGRIVAAGLMEKGQLERLGRLRTEYEGRLESLVEEAGRFFEVQARFESHCSDFVALGAEVEEVGDGAVEILEKNPDEPLSWNGGLARLWAAADGGMESNIGFLWQLYHLQRLIAGGDPKALRTKVEEAVAFHKEAAAEMLETGVFDDHRTSKGAPMAASYREGLAQYERLLWEYFDGAVRFRSINDQYQVAADELLTFLGEFEDTADAVVEGQSDRIAEIVSSAERWIWICLAGGLVVAIGAAITLSRSIVSPLRRLSGTFHDLGTGDGDLTVRLPAEGKDELADVGRSYNSFVERVSATIVRVRDGVGELHEAVRAIDTLSSRLGSGAQGTAEEAGGASSACQRITEGTQTVAAGTDQLTTSIEEISRSAQEAMDVARTAVELANRTSETMHELGSSSAEIGGVLTLINAIAEQTNLLALNATIEAARAGDAGKGFAVVAGEVKELAKQTASATDEIADRVDTIQARTQTAAQAIQEVGTVIDRISSISTSIAGAVEEQSATARDIGQRIEQTAGDSREILGRIEGVSSRADDTRAGASETQAAAERLAGLHGALSQLVGQFKV